jgi:hypothetical protein
MLLLALAGVLVSGRQSFTERAVIRLSFAAGSRRDFAFPVPNSAVVFERSEGFQALLGTGKGKVQQFGSVDSHSAAIGGFFGPKLGKIRIIAHANCTVVFYALVPPQPSCEVLFVATAGAAPFEIGDRPTSNVSNRAGLASCLWYVGPGTHEYHFTAEGLAPNDTIEAQPLGKPPESIVGRRGLVSSDGIDFFYYRSSGADRSRVFGVRRTGREIAGLPVVATSLLAGGSATAIKEARAVEKGDGVVLNVKLSFTTIFLLILTGGMLAIMIVLLVLLMIARCTQPSAVRARQAAEARQSHQTLLQGSAAWPFRTGEFLGRATELNGIPRVLPIDSDFWAI